MFWSLHPSFSEYSYARRLILVNNAVQTQNIISVSCLLYNLTSVGVRNPGFFMWCIFLFSASHLFMGFKRLIN